jgi:hypothetical protein
MNKMHICHYVAYNNPPGAKRILDAWGVPVKSGNKQALAQSLRALLRQEGEPVLMDLANMHPDKELILKVEEIKAERNNPESSADGAGNCPCGCGGACKEKKSGACGCGSNFGGPWNANESAFYSSNRNPIIDEFQVYGADGPESQKQVNKSTILFGGVALLLLYTLYKNG